MRIATAALERRIRFKLITMRKTQLVKPPLPPVYRILGLQEPGQFAGGEDLLCGRTPVRIHHIEEQPREPSKVQPCAKSAQAMEHGVPARRVDEEKTARFQKTASTV